MVEFSVDLTKKFSDKQALQKRLTYRLLTKARDIAYVNYGLDYSLFTYISPEFAIQNAVGAACEVEVTGTRVIVAGVTVDLGGADGIS